ncbi:MAG: PD40 domain-containing protein [Planctomycetes bacterium]|nr:PD40 domain-containing protein [Planctomycetota bacterium]
MKRLLWLAISLCLCSSVAEAQWTQRASVDSSGAQATGASAYPVISADGRFLAFESLASNLVPGDSNARYDVFVRDLQTGTTERASVGPNGVEGNGDSTYAAISPDGRFVGFQSRSTNFAAGDTNGFQDVFVRDRLLGTTERVSLGSLGTQGNKDCMGPSVSADGRYLAFMSQASNLVTPDYTSTFDCFLRDRVAGTTVRVSEAYTGGPANLYSYWPVLSADGRFVAFHSAASNVTSNDFNGTVDVFLYDVATRVNELLSVSSGGVQGDFASSYPSISADGRYVAFHSIALNLAAGDTDVLQDVFLRDRLAGTTELISVGLGGAQPDADCGWVSLSADGRFVVFESAATNLAPGDTNGVVDIFRVDRQSGSLERVDLGPSGVQSNAPSYGGGVSADGRWVCFASSATNLVLGDTNALDDAFARDFDAAGFSSLCAAGSAGVLSCPCGNPAAGAGRGCDNSSSTGGATLAASGAAYLSADALHFATSGQKPSSTSVLLQGDTLVPGVLFGQGVRCAGGVLKRLYVRPASSGSVALPDPAFGDLSVSSRSAALGDPIQPGTSRFYVVYYRDPIVLGGCAPTSTFNATQTGEVRWSF